MSLSEFIARLDKCKALHEAEAIFSEAFYAMNKGGITRAEWDRLGEIIRERWPAKPRRSVDAGGPRCARGWTGD